MKRALSVLGRGRSGSVRKILAVIEFHSGSVLKNAHLAGNRKHATRSRELGPWATLEE